MAIKRCGAIVFGLAVVAASGAAACPAPEALHVKAFDRAFVQEKFMSGMAHPLRSEGRMSARDSEIVWHMLKPFDVKTIITPNGITQSIDGATPTAVNTGTGAMAASIARSMAAIMRGDWAELRAMFAVTLPDANPKGDWTVQLMPLDQRLQALLGKIAVQGCSDVSRVDVERPDGDREHIQFTTLP